MKRFEQYKSKIEAYLLKLQQQMLEESGYYKELTDSMCYSLKAGGKRIRPVMLLAACEMAGGDVEKALPFAAAMEMIHTSSLIHDDLPAMDNDDLRRGKPTNHKVYGEATALLAGDAMLLYPFELMAKSVTDIKQVRAISIIAESAGLHGMCGGQMIDLYYEGKKADADVISQLNRLKTGALFKASVCAGIALAGGSEEEIRAGEVYGDNIGMAFQLVDDLLDNDPDADTGKTKGSDIASGKSTYLSVYGAEKCKELIASCTKDAAKALSDAFGEKASFLISLARQMENRNN
ncbi:MAG: polyprenyl synthetase family protein [Clostridia bacterium]|nr:polyprenyl synthetase family protein [Clostridia bacterium]